MKLKHKTILLITTALLALTALSVCFAHTDSNTSRVDFPKQLESYKDPEDASILAIIRSRIKEHPFNVVATLIFFAAIIHTMLVSFFHNWAFKFEHRYEELKKEGLRDKSSQSMMAGVCHLLGEVEAVFGIWAIALAVAIASFFNWHTFVSYVNNLHYTEPLFIVVVMTIASSRPILKLFELLMWRIVNFFGGTLEAWWLIILIFAPLLGSLVTEPAAMTIAAFLLSDKFYILKPSNRLKYATLALLFVNVSVGGSLTNFASPPILMVAGPWGWDSQFMLLTFGFKSIAAIILCTIVYFILFRKDLSDLKETYEDYRYKRHIQHRFISKKELESNFDDLEKLVDKRVGFTSELNAYSVILKENIKELAALKLTEEEQAKYDISNAIDEKFEGIKIEEFNRTIPGLMPNKDETQIFDANWDAREDRVPKWIMLVNILFLIWTVFNSHEPVLFLSGFLFYLGFYQVTAFYQNRMDLKPALLVAFFIGGLMVHGGLQGWWIAPLLANLPELGLNITSIVLTAFNDNAAITYLSTLVTDFPDTLKYAIVTGAITGGGLTVIANSPNPVGQSILKKHFEKGVSSLQLLKFALLPTFITGLIFFLTR
ncbi:MULTISPECIES: putative Na+/H+ antiporter [unclassified Fusibacter]|uniref:putative Na+/H+ antiporter n=1 Tax=unclassified Fusibacter TaxID=2624464 RepID=UPI0019D6F143|nr:MULTISPECIES: putative Na+/H+ antiporter [unclassified Fusibacter]MCK8059659.1 putative Na+/H+ antiporter [Fusibacter sp. A2]